MLLIPAIDLKDGHCVRLKQGDMDQSTTFGEDPAAMARKWVDAGARRLHLVDLNGAFAGTPKNYSAIKSILKEVGDDIPVQLGGGIRDLDTIEKYIDGSRFKVPQMGWNQVRQVPHGGAVHPVWAGIPDNSYFYFVHSFYARPQSAAHCAGEANYGGVFAAAIARDNIFAAQFHPEKSAEHGLALYRNFLHWNP